MAKYPMLSGMDEQRVQQVGGKAAILEEIVKRWPQANIPPFTTEEDSFFGKAILRASSELDVLGGFGLYPTYTDIPPSWLNETYSRIRNLDENTEARIQVFCESIGMEMPSYSVILQ